MTEKKQKSFVLYSDFEGALLRLSMRERGMLITSIYSYVNRGSVDIEMTPLVDILFTMIRAQLDRDREKYEEKCKKNAENGKKGGRPRKNTESEWFSKKAKKAYNDSDNKSDSYIDNDNDNEFRLGSSFDPEDFFEAAVRRTLSDMD